MASDQFQEIIGHLSIIKWVISAIVGLVVLSITIIFWVVRQIWKRANYMKVVIFGKEGETQTGIEHRLTVVETQCQERHKRGRK